jgi:hypothetical protein
VTWSKGREIIVEYQFAALILEKVQNEPGRRREAQLIRAQRREPNH